MLVLLKIQTNISHSVMTHFRIDFAPEKQSSVSPNWPIALLSKYSISTNKRSMKLTFSQQTLFRKRVVSLSLSKQERRKIRNMPFGCFAREWWYIFQQQQQQLFRFPPNPQKKTAGIVPSFHLNSDGALVL